MRTKKTLPVAAAVALLGALSCLPAAHSTMRMEWQFSTNSSALCNDFTRAGYFLRRNITSDDWVIFLESGGLCYSTDTCNRRFYLPEIRDRFKLPLDEGGFGPYGNFDLTEAYEGTVGSGDYPRDVFTPLMSSMSCFRNKTEYFPDGFSVLGTDILDQDSDNNPLFWSYNHVVIPYCSSDVWLGNEMDGTRDNTIAQSECDCFDYACFNYEPNSDNLQFTFRGKIIFESIITDLMDMGLGHASRLVVAGSSAGGLGVLNNAKYVKETLLNTTDLSVIFDSAWFINFQGNIFREFDGTLSQSESETQNQNAGALLETIKSTEACNDTDLGFPCCISAYCIFTKTNNAGERYYPSDVPAFGIFSLYDIFLLAPSLAGLVQLGGEGNAVGYAINFLRVVGEYGGDMNSTLAFTEPKADFFSYYVTQCFQHVYLATSSLWGAEGASVFGNSSVELDRDVASFRHVVQAGIWNTNPLAGGVTMSMAISKWYENRNSDLITPISFWDSCTGPHCNMQCPEEFELGNLSSDNWAVKCKVVISIIIVGITFLCLIMKVIFELWLCRLNWKQNAYLDTFETDPEEAEDMLQFPDCPDEDAISVACLNLNYSVTFRVKKVKDEKRDHLTPLVLHNITPEGAVEDEDDDDPFGHFGSSRRRRKDSNLKSPPNSERIRSFVTKTSGHFGSPTKDPEANILTHTLNTNTSSLPPEEPVAEEMPKKTFGRRQKQILKDISIYFNPGDMVGIMGPSGCGKTTFLDLLTGRRKTGTSSGEIYINGMNMVDVRDWYVANTGYVLQLATPYYEELTVRENLTLAAAMKLPDTFTLRETFERVEQVMEVSGLSQLANINVGGATGPGLSGGQKRRLAVALQLLKLPNVIFLDEPTSGLDAASSFELLSHLNKLADSNRTIILTIHQPRLEIFHMFHRLVLLSEGKVAYHGVPEKAYEVFVNALKSRYLELGLIIPQLEDHNPADVIMDMLGNPKMRKLITEYYQASCEPRLVTRAIKAARSKEQSLSSNSLDTQWLHSLIWGAKRPGQCHAGLFSRLATLEARASKRANLFQVAYLPVIFLLYGIMLGTVYLQTSNPILVISGYTVYSVASALFMFPVLYHYFSRALEVYTYERGDGVGMAYDLIIQGFIRGVATAAVPVVVCAGVLYVLLVNHNSYNLTTFCQVVLVNMALNQTWTALLIALICSFPSIAFRLSPIIASLAGFTSGFFIPVEQIPWWYRWMVYINPNYYGFSSSSFFLLSDFDSGCQGTQFECFTSSGEYILQQFNFDNINPYLHIIILFSFTKFYLILATCTNWVRYTTIKHKLWRVCRTVFRMSTEDAIEKEPDEPEDKRLETDGASLNEDEITPLASIGEGSEEHSAFTPHTRAVINWKVAASRSLDSMGEDTPEEETTFTGPVQDVARDTESGEEVRPGVHKVRVKDPSERPTQLNLEENEAQAPNSSTQPEKPPPKSLFLREGATHMVWKPKAKKTAPQFANMVTAMLRTKEAPQNLRQRQKTLAFRVLATQAVLREQNEELITGDLQPEQQKKHISLKEASKQILKKEKTQLNMAPSGGMHLTDIVSQFVESEHKQQRSSKLPIDGECSPTKMSSEGSKHFSRAPLFKRPSQAAGILKRPRNSIRNINASSPAIGVVPLKKWKDLVREHRKLQSVVESEGDDIKDRAPAKSPVVKQSAVDIEGSSLWIKPERVPPRDSPSLLQRQEWTEILSVEKTSKSTNSKIKEEHLQEEETAGSIEDVTQSTPSRIQSSSPSLSPSGDATDPKPDEKGPSVVDLQTRSNALVPIAVEFRTVLSISGQPATMRRYHSAAEQRSRTPNSHQTARRKVSTPPNR